MCWDTRAPHYLNMLNLDFTDNTKESISTAINLAKDYVDAQVQPTHIAFALLNEDSGDQPSLSGGFKSLFSTVIEKASSDLVHSNIMLLFDLLSTDQCQTQPSKVHHLHIHAESTSLQ